MNLDAIYKEAKPAIVIKNCLDLLHEPGEVFEVRIPKTRAGTISGYFDDTAKAAMFISKENGKHQAIYATINPVDHALLARMENKLSISQVTTTDSEIAKRRWFLLDFDPVRPAGISSTTEELEAAKSCAQIVVEWLSSLGWPAPVQACSGNGWHLMYRVDLPNDDKTKIDIEMATKMLSSIFSTHEVSIDVSVFNASRVWKVYGTLSMKGSSTEERPHRVARIEAIPEKIEEVTAEQIEAIGRPLRDAKSDEFKDMTGEYISDIVKWLTDRGQTVTSGPRPLFGNEGQKWTISRCPFNPEHKDPVIGLIGQRPIFRCLHNSCSAYRWKEFREKIDPTYKDPDTIKVRLESWCNGNSEEIDKELLQSACALGNKLPNVLKTIRKSVDRGRLLVLEEKLKQERRQFIKETIGENNEKGNIVGLINRTKSMQADGVVPMYWIAEYDHRVRVGPLGDVNCPRLTESDEIALMVKFHGLGDSWVKQTHAGQIIRYLAEEYRVNPLRIMLKKKRWDGQKRLDNWLSHYMGTKDDEYTRAVGRKWFISAVARGMDPGCQADHMLIFEGRQGVGKSQAARIIGGEFYVEYSGSIASHNAEKDLVAVITGKMIVEMSELATFRKTDINSLKTHLSKCVDEVRLSYERDAKSYPRTCVFLGTTNEIGTAYIADTTGARRFWPVTVAELHGVKTALLKEDVEQLWAEAVEAYEDGEDWHTVPKTLVTEEQSQRQMLLEDHDPWYTKIRNALTEPDSYDQVFHIVNEYDRGVATGQFVVRCGAPNVLLGILLGIETSKQGVAEVARVRKIMNILGFKRVRPAKGWLGFSYAYDLAMEAAPHLWPAIRAAKESNKFPKPKDQREDVN